MKSTIKSYSTNSSACRALSKIGEAALQKSHELIKKVNGKFAFDLEQADAIQRVADFAAAQKDTASVSDYKVHGLTHCPHCNVHLSNGIGGHGDEVNGKKVKHKKFEYACLACGEEFGPEIPKAKAKIDPNHGMHIPRPVMAESLKLDRRIVSVDTDGSREEWKNAHKMWKANPSWMTSSQQDMLTAKLYAAAKAGESIEIVINDRKFFLANVQFKA